ncbi:pyridoxal 5'-phosphate synthase glutaminase subunit PdxT [Spirochaeta lutea]|uniref:Pyridoxal 5'-phosphate synthase subunit PdxT n=1 Tax=Spirochaeta lutea TaxID=1480694 RepID=A0A098R255_9SPIO|nr:pyridoxal 5'-phosphate synthase glutaminase subunit PdxT [Spirochaeta lutea]KGE73748.1 glutamine amidotransferase [Spirochaeta lutea]
MKTIGVLALQGGFAKHLQMVSSLGVTAVPVRSEEELGTLDGIILPGGESTTIGMLLERRGLLAPLKEKIAGGMPVFGTCAGMILLAETIEHHHQSHIGLMDITVERNAYGSQVESFEADLEVDLYGVSHNLRGIFIRAPRIVRAGINVEVLSRFSHAPVLIRQKNMLAASFHPELGSDPILHEFFISHVL